MKNLSFPACIGLFLVAIFSFMIPLPNFAQAPNPGGRIAQKVIAFKQQGSFSKETSLFSIAPAVRTDLEKSLKRFTILNASTDEILSSKPTFLKFAIPVDNGARLMVILLYKESISPNGFSLISSDGKPGVPADIVHYRGSIDGDENSLAAFSFSAGEASGFISNADGNYVIGRLQDNSGSYIIYNDLDVITPMSFDCGTNTALPMSAGTYLRGTESASALTTKCVNWYWETDYDLFVNKGSVAGVNTYMQNVFNQVATLYANDGVSITLKTLYIWSTADPYTGPSTSNYLDQFGVNRTSFDGDLATLIGTQGGGGIAWINGLCKSPNKYKMAYCGISTSYSVVPTYSWTVECITHEQGHLLGSRHTHDCVWNGNNTKIDGCGDNAGYPSGSCANPGNPTGGGTIMSYCHLTSVGIKFNLGFGPQPKALIVSNVNNASCLSACSGGCTVPGQPAAITGNTAVCQGITQTYSVAAVSGATAYIWILPSGWTGSSTTNIITITPGVSGGNISVTATNTCGSGTVQTKAVTVSAVPAQPATISGNSAVCAASAQIYSIAAIAGATSYTWVLPSGWTGSSTTNTINTTAGSAGGIMSVKGNNSCGSGSAKTFTVSITASAPVQPGNISGALTVCPGSIQTYSINAVAGASTYSWTLPLGWTGSSTTNSITVTAGASAGNISVTASNGCGTSVARSLPVNVGGSTPAQPGAINVSGGTANVCAGDNRIYSVTQGAGLTFNWSLPAGATITAGQGTYSVNVLFNSSFVSGSSISVTATNSCGTGAASSLTISKNTISRPGTISISGGTSKVCNGDVRTYSVTAVPGITYNWIAPSGGNITSGQGTATIIITYNANFTVSGTLSVTANNSCGTSSPRSLTIARNVPGRPASVSGPSTVCAGAIATYTAASVSTATSYVWTIPTGAIFQGASNGNVITVKWGTTGGNVSVRAANACGTSGSRSRNVTISCTGGIAGSINEYGNEISVTVFPNPSHSIATVRFFAMQKAAYILTITDLAGRALIKENHQALRGVNIHRLDLSKFVQGLYLISIEGNNKKETIKINVQ